jgi:hypothetical protein
MNTRISIFPKSSLGKWPVGLAVAWIVVFVLSEVLVGFEVLGSGSNHALAAALTIVVACIGGAVLVTGIISTIKSKERSALVFLTTAIGLYGLFGSVVSLLGLAK